MSKPGKLKTGEFQCLHQGFISRKWLNQDLLWHRYVWLDEGSLITLSTEIRRDRWCNDVKGKTESFQLQKNYSFCLMWSSVFVAHTVPCLWRFVKPLACAVTSDPGWLFSWAPSRLKVSSSSLWKWHTASDLLLMLSCSFLNGIFQTLTSIVIYVKTKILTSFGGQKWNFIT